MLFNSDYYDRFMYLSQYQEKDISNKVVSRYTHREMKQLSTHIARCITDLAYMPKSWARDFEFNAKYLFNNKKSFYEATSYVSLVGKKN